MKYLSCDYLDLSIISLDSFICNASPVNIQASSSSENINYQWLYGGVEITGATDSTYSALIPGTYTVRIKDSVCSKTSAPILVQNGSLETVGLTLPQTSFCANDSAITLNGGVPSGGVYSGPGVVGNTFDPSLANLGMNVINYIYTQSTGCVDTVSANVQVSLTPSVVLFQAFSNACVGDSINLNTGFPAGGVYSGDGVSGSQFAPQPNDTGLVSIYYTLDNGFGCSASDSITVNVLPVPSVAFNLALDSTCEISSPISLTGATPAGGTFSGTGVSGNFFIPAIVSPGYYPITYTVTQGGCSDSETQYIQVDSFPSVVLPTLDSICVSATSYPLDHGYPGGGTFIGAGISNNIFDASAVGVGVHNMMYVYENACAADTAYSTITVIASPTISASIIDVSCNGLSDGQAVAVATGGNGPYDFTWSNGDSTNVTSGLISGNYSVTVNGESGCVASNTFSVSQPNVLALALDSLDDVVCNGFSDGKAFVSTSGGTTPYNYVWSNGALTEDVTNLSFGTHQLLVTDANGCQDSLSVTINEVNPIAIAGSSVDVSCTGFADGSASITASSGGGLFSYAWSSGQTTASINSLDTGSYVITVSDQNGCQTSDTFHIDQPDSLLVSLSATDLTCSESNDGSISSTVSGGTGTYTYAWSNGSTSNSISSLATGSYTLTVTDDNSCQTIESALVNQPDSLDLTITESSSILCNSNSDGQLTASTVGGTAPFNYTWSNGAASSVNTNLTANLYAVTVTDANGCFKTASATLTEPSVLSIQIDSVLDASCFGLNDGYAEVSTSGGTGAITYLWSNGTATPNASVLVSGSYSVTATDANGCAVNTSLSIAEPTEISLTVSSSDVTCFGGNDGQAIATASNGQGAFTYAWSNGSASATNASLSAQTYTVTVTDAAGCFKVDTAVVDEPTQLMSMYTASNNACFGDSTGQITAAVSGGTLPYSYAWSNGETTSSVDSLMAGSYAVTITDDNGCQIDSSFTLSQPTALVLSIDSASDLLCFNDASGSIGASASGGTSVYSFLWNDNATSAIRSGIATGTYSVTLTDANGCVEETSLTITEPPLLSIQVNAIQDLLCFGDTNGSIDAIANGGTAPITYAWSNGENTAQLTNIIAGNYSLTVTDDNGCMADSVIALSQPDSIAINASIILALCDNTNDGSIATSVIGGVAPYSYAWSNAETADSISGLEAGNYTLTVTDDNACSSTQLITLGFEFAAPQPQLGNDTGYCTNDSLELHAGVLGATYSWSTGDSTESITIQDAGIYSVFVTETTGCSGLDTIEVVEFELPAFDLGNDTILCIADLELGLELNGPTGQAVYAWSIGSTQQSETVNAFGTYFLTVESAEGCTFTDSISIANDTCVGISDAAREHSILIYPNPNFGQFTVSGAAMTEKNAQLKIYNADGRLVLQRSTQSATEAIDLSLHGAGVYYVHFLKDSAPVNVKKVVVY